MSENYSYQDYLKQAFINERLVLFLNKYPRRSFLNWIFVATYYAAIHYLNAFLKYKNYDIPKKHTGKSMYEFGSVESAKKHLSTNKNKIIDAAGTDFEQLFHWSCDIRYKPRRYQLLGKKEIKNALVHLKAVRLVVFNELEIKPKWDNTYKKIRITKINKRDLRRLSDERQEDLGK